MEFLAAGSPDELFHRALRKAKSGFEWNYAGEDVGMARRLNFHDLSVASCRISAALWKTATGVECIDKFRGGSPVTGLPHKGARPGPEHHRRRQKFHGISPPTSSGTYRGVVSLKARSEALNSLALHIKSPCSSRFGVTCNDFGVAF